MTPIDSHYSQHAAMLGLPSQPEENVKVGSGMRRMYERGAIYYHPTTGAFEVHGGLLTMWNELGGCSSYLGYPVSDEQDFLQSAYDTTVAGICPSSIDNKIVGRCSYFQGGCIVWWTHWNKPVNIQWQRDGFMLCLRTSGMRTMTPVYIDMRKNIIQKAKSLCSFEWFLRADQVRLQDIPCDYGVSLSENE